uniref:FAD/NAD(P)-binding domain-containing protein n=1 Tax=Peronospora matthiolae TaxID=2874970 RepID=A0AAV1UI28_9STRA
MPTRIVIIGGGAAGINTAQTLAKKLEPSDETDVVLLEKSSYFYHVVGAPRAFVDAKYASKMFIPYKNAIPSHAVKFVRIIRGVARGLSVHPNEVLYHAIDSDDREGTVTAKLEFDYLVLATGSTYSVPMRPEIQDFARSVVEAKLLEVRGHIERAEQIVVVGGGAVGCEVAGEIKSKWPDKSVTIVEANERLVSGNNLNAKFHLKLNSSLSKLGVKVIRGERLTERLCGNVFEKRVVRTDKGTNIEADIQLLCGGFTPVVSLVQELDASLITQRGAVKVNSHLQVEGEGYAHLFALGDMCSHPAPKMAYIAGEQGKFLAGELAAVIHKKQQGFPNPFEVPAVAATILPLGPSGGVSQLPVWGGVVVGDWITWLLKSRDYFAGRIWASIGATVPN